MATEEKAVQILQARLEAEGGSAPITSLSVKVKWGQHDLQGLGHIRKFLSKHHEVFVLEGSSVELVKSSPLVAETAPKTTSKFAPKVPPASLAPSPKEAPMKRGGAEMAIGPVGPTKFSRLNDGLRSQGLHHQDVNGTVNARTERSESMGNFDLTEDTAVTAMKATLLATAKMAARANAKVTARNPLIAPIAPIAPTPKGKAFESFAKEEVALKEESSERAKSPKSPAREPPPWHAQRALTRAAMQGTTVTTPRQDAPNPTKTSWDDDTLTDDELRKAIAASKAHGMELELEDLARKLTPSDEYRKDCQRAVLLLKSAFAQEFPQKGIHFMYSPRMETGGSTVQNTEVEGSDLDVICYSIPGTPEEQESKMGRLWERICSPSHSNNLEATDAMRLFPHASCQFSVKLKGPGDPVAKLHAHVILETTGDPSRTLDHVIQQLCDCYPASRDLVRLVKFWATNHGLSGHDGYMNGIAWTAFVLCFLQRQQHVPPVAKLGMNLDGKLGAKAHLTELLRGFFQFVCAPQPTTPRGLSLEGVDCTAAPPPTSHVGPPPPLYIEDPVAAQQGVQKNLASTLGESQWTRVLEESRRIGDRLDPAKPQRWFYWAEVFDPQGVGAGGKRLPKLSEMAGSTQGDEEGATRGAANQDNLPSQNSSSLLPPEAAAGTSAKNQIGATMAGKGCAPLSGGNWFEGKGQDVQKGIPTSKGWPTTGA